MGRGIRVASVRVNLQGPPVATAQELEEVAKGYPPRVAPSPQYPDLGGARIAVVVRRLGVRSVAHGRRVFVDARRSGHAAAGGKTPEIDRELRPRPISARARFGAIHDPMRFLRNVLIALVVLVALLFLATRLGGSDFEPFNYGGF